MIALLTGVLIRRSHHDVIIDCNGVGYQVFITKHTQSCLPIDGEPICLEIYTHVKEDAFTLFGFLDMFEKTVFEMLLGVSGIGPKMAMNVLSGLSALKLVQALASGQISTLTQISGVGKKTAERLVLELKTQAQKIHVLNTQEEHHTTNAVASPIESELFSALVNLGYKNHEVAQVVDIIIKEHPTLSLESALREGLHRLRNKPAN